MKWGSHLDYLIFLLQDEDKYKEKVTIHKNVQTGRGF